MLVHEEVLERQNRRFRVKVFLEYGAYETHIYEIKRGIFKNEKNYLLYKTTAHKNNTSNVSMIQLGQDYVDSITSVNRTSTDGDFTIRGKLINKDLDNKLSAMINLLKRKGIIEDDKEFYDELAAIEVMDTLSKGE